MRTTSKILSVLIAIAVPAVSHAQVRQIHRSAHPIVQRTIFLSQFGGPVTGGGWVVGGSGVSAGGWATGGYASAAQPYDIGYTYALMNDLGASRLGPTYAAYAEPAKPGCEPAGVAVAPHVINAGTTLSPDGEPAETVR